MQREEKNYYEEFDRHDSIKVTEMENLIRRCITGELSSENNKILPPIISSEFFNGVKVSFIYLNRYDLTLLN
jgi:hypothetical protein